MWIKFTGNSNKIIGHNYSKIPDDIQTGFPFTTLHFPLTPQNTKSHGLP